MQTVAHQIDTARATAIEASEASLEATNDAYSHLSGAELHEAAAVAHEAAGDAEAAQAHHRAAVAQRFMALFTLDEANELACEASIAAHIASDAANGIGRRADD